MPDLYRLSRLVVMPSLEEPFGLVATEALACGVPVIASNRGGLPEIVKDGRTGMIVDPTNTKALARAIARLLDDEKLRERMGRLGRKDVQNKHSMSLHAQRLVGLYARVCGQSKLSP